MHAVSSVKSMHIQWMIGLWLQPVLPHQAGSASHLPLPNAFSKNYAVSADERIIEMDYDKLVYEKDSPYQNIRIVHSKKNGNTLFLDGDASMYPMRTTLITKM